MMTHYMNRKPATFGSALMVLTAAVVFGRCENVAAQRYYYEPHPDYYHNDTARGTVAGVAWRSHRCNHCRQEGPRGRRSYCAGVGALTGNMLGRSKDRADHRAPRTARP